MERIRDDNSLHNDQFFAAVETPRCESLGGADAGGDCHGTRSEGESKRPSTDGPNAGSSGIAGATSLHEKEKSLFCEEEIYGGRLAGMEEEREQVTLHEGHFTPRSQSRSSVEKSKSTRITLSDMPVIIDEDLNDSIAAEEKGAQKSSTPITAAPSNETSMKRTKTEKLRFRSTLATFIDDGKGLYGEWKAKECAATAAAKELLQMLAQRVEDLLNEATAVTGRLLCRKYTLREEELQRRDSSRKISSSLFPLFQPDNACAEETDENGREIEHGIGNRSDQKVSVKAERLQSAAVVESDTGSMKRVAAELMDNLLKVAMQHRSEMSQNDGEEARRKDSSGYRDSSEGKSLVGGKVPDGCQEKQTTATEKGRFSFEEPHPTIMPHFSQSSLESYNAGNFPEDLTCRQQGSQVLTKDIESTREKTSVCGPKACEGTQIKRDKIWKIFGRETQAGRLLYQLYKPAEPGGDLVYPVPKSIKDLRGNPNFRMLAHASSSSLAAAAGRHPKRHQVKVAVPRVGRQAARAGAAAGGGTSSKKFEKGNFLSGRGSGGKRSMRQIAKETEKRRQQILEEASSRGVAAAAMGLKRDREKVLMLQKLPYTICSLLPKAARLPPLSAKDRAVFFAEKAAADRASLYSAGSASPSPRARKSSNDTSSNDSSSRRNCSPNTSACSHRSSRTAKIPTYSRSNKLEDSLGRGIIDPCTQTLVPYVAAARQRYKKQGLVDAETGMTEEQKQLFVQTLKEIQLRKQKLENLQKALPDHVLAASLHPLEEKMFASNQSSGRNSNDGGCSSSSGCTPCSSKTKSRPQSGAETIGKETNLFSSCFSSDVAKRRLAQRTILQQLQDETKLKREIEGRMKELEALISISDAQQLELKRNKQVVVPKYQVLKK